MGAEWSSAPASIELDDSVGEHLGPDREPSPRGQAGQGRVGHHADAHLQGCSVGHQTGQPFAHDARRVVGRRGRRLVERRARLERVVDVGRVDAGVAVRPRHTPVDLGDYQAAAGLARRDRRRQDVDLRPEGQLPFDGRGHGDADRVGGERAFEQPRHQRQPCRHVGQRRASAHPRSHEAGLVDHPRARRDACVRVEHEQPVLVHGVVEQCQHLARRRPVATRDDAGTGRQSGQPSGQLPAVDDAHRRPSPRIPVSPEGGAWSRTLPPGSCAAARAWTAGSTRSSSPSSRRGTSARRSAGW